MSSILTTATAQLIGNIAAIAFWLSSAVIALTVLVMVIFFDRSDLSVAGGVLAATVITNMASVGIMILAYRRVTA